MKSKNVFSRILDFYREFEGANIAGVLAKKSRIFDRFLRWWLERKRKYFLSSPGREVLHDRLIKFYAPFMLFYMNARPEKFLSSDMLERRDFLIRNAKPKAVDIGMQDGYFVRQLKKNGIDTAGTDCVGLLVNMAKKSDPSGEYYRCFAETTPFPDSTFQTAICSHILEHVLRPEDVLKEIHRILKTGGEIIVVVPYSLEIEPTHLREYNNKDSLLAEVGRFFKIKSYYEKIGEGHGCIGVKEDRVIGQ
jgi:SAM-dependent methyltransferase